MKLSKDKFMIFCFAWGICLYLLGFALSRFYLLSLGLIPFAIYEFIRTEGKKNTKPLSILVTIVLAFQFLHSSNIYSFPFDISFLTDLLPLTIPPYLDQFIFFSVIALVIMSFLLIRYTWGSVTKFLAIMLLVGSLIQAYLFWPEIQMMLQSPQGQKIMEGSKERIQKNIFYRLRRELLY